MKKNNYSYIWVSLVILVFGVIFIPRIIDRVKTGTVVDADRHAVGKQPTSEKLEIVGKVPNFEFLNQNNLTISNRDYSGKVYLVEFFFTTCPTICPIMNRNMVLLQNEFKAEKNFAIASFTINPEHDTPQVLKAYSEKYKVTNPNWHMLTGDKQKIYDLANKGFNLYTGENANVNGGFEHSGMFALIDKEGNIRSRKDPFGNPIIYYDGIEYEGIAMLKEDIKNLLNE